MLTQINMTSVAKVTGKMNEQAQILVVAYLVYYIFYLFCIYIKLTHVVAYIFTMYIFMVFV